MEAERRQVTVLFTDMVGFTTFAEQSGEEAAFGLMRSLSKLIDEAVRDQGGVVHGFTGDGIMAVFGAPVAFEDGPLRACRAALSMLQKLSAAEADFKSKHGVRPQLRIGLNTGAAVVGKVQEGTEAGITALGDTVNFASRLQTLAEPDSIYMTEATYRLVDGMVEAQFVGAHVIKGKLGPQKLFRLHAIRPGASRFESAVSRGLSAFVGRERDLEELERGLDKGRSRQCVVDVVAEPGMGKSRLIHELRRRIGKDRAFVLAGSCSSDGQQTPFLPFIEVVRGSFRVSAGQAESDIEQSIETGLMALGLNAHRNLGLLLHLLGLKVPGESLKGLDGVLIGLRTRELLQHLLEARCRLSPVVMIIEDLHWIDSVSEELLNRLVRADANLRLLIITSRRPEYFPPWLDGSDVITLRLEALATDDICRVAQARLGVNSLPAELARQLGEKAEGNPLFIEEIVSFLTERGMLRVASGIVDFDAHAVSAALPASLQSLLTGRVDRLAPSDRALLQAASVIGRRFDPELLAKTVGESRTAERLETMEAFDLVRRENKSNNYAFKHALVRDALYQSMLSGTREALHLKIAEEIERRSGNRLTEVAEVLAHHYRETSHARKAFAYLAMAGAKSLGVYSLDEATTYFTEALGVLDRHPECASDDQIAEYLVSHTFLLNMTAQINRTINIVERYLVRINHLMDDPRAVLIRHHYVFALLWNARYQVVPLVQRETLQMSERLGTNRAMAYALAGEILVSTVVAPKPLPEFEALKRKAIKAASDTTDVYIQNWTRFAIAWEEFHQGRMNEARESARDLMRVGQQLNDPRSTGLGLCILAVIALLSDAYAEALDYSEQSIALAVTPFDRETAVNIKGCALTLLRRTDDGLRVLDAFRRRCFADGDLYSLATSDVVIGVSKVFTGKIGQGIGLLEEAISKRDREGYRAAADWYRLFLGEVYLQIVEGNEKLRVPILLKNLPILLKILATAAPRVRELMEHVLADPRFHPAGYIAGRANMILGLFYKAKKKPMLAVCHLTQARSVLSQFGETPILTRVEAALAELSQ